jgi:Uma2 family endonuclease
MTITTISPPISSEENQLLPEQEWELMPEPDVSNIVIEDGKPVDSWISEKQQRLLTAVLYSSFETTIPFLVTANVGLFYAINKPPLVTDVMLSLKVKCPKDWNQKKNRSYFTWNMGKSPEVAIEIVSNKIGNELGSKLEDYIDAGIFYYVVFDPLQYLSETVLQVYERRGDHYELKPDFWLEGINLGLTLWSGEFEGQFYEQWLRWCDRSGNILFTGDEKAESEKQRAESEKQRAESEKQRADRLVQILREQGIYPDQF